ncbi:thioester reductase domain-containing protein [Wukongibacter sp. M2B1]|uniref:thioester reductase domain-containing protein n=1 Tax=Wukongibacter sp. M2B1 TaxID=3088895 RepID=UPI003D79026F
MKDYYNKLLERQVIASAEKIAIDTKDQKLTYLQMFNLIEISSQALYNSSCKKGDTVALIVKNPVNFIVWSMSIFKEGYTVLPINPDEPITRKKHMLKGEGVSLIVTDDRESSELFDYRTIYIDKEYEQGVTMNISEDMILRISDLLVFKPLCSSYPEGILLKKEYIANWIYFNKSVLNLELDKTLFVYDNISEIYNFIWLPALMDGGTIYIRSNKDFSEIENIYRAIEKYEIKCVLLSLGIFKDIKHKSLSDINRLKSLKYFVTFGEETFDCIEIKRLIRNRGVKWYNYFGFPFIHFVTTLDEDVERGKRVFYHEGKPIKNVYSYVLNSVLEPQPKGTYGNLYSSFESKYISMRDQRIHQKVIHVDPYRDNNYIFSTGYRAKMLSNGRYRIIENIDKSFYRNGQYVSLLELERVALGHTNIKECIALKVDEDLYLYYTSNMYLSYYDVESYLRQSLPKSYFPIKLMSLNSLSGNKKNIIEKIKYERNKILDSEEIYLLQQELSTKLDIVDCVVRTSYQEVDEYFQVDSLDENCLESRSVKTDYSENITEDIKIPKKNDKLAISKNEALNVKDIPKTLHEVLVKASKSKGKTFYLNKEGYEVIQTYEDLLSEARKIAHGIKEAGFKPGDKVIFQFTKEQDFIETFWGCILSGVIPAPLAVSDYNSKNSGADNLYKIWEILDNPSIIASSEIYESISKLNNVYKRKDALSVYSIDSLKSCESIQDVYNGNENDTAVIMFTSGSTGVPKGVMLSHRNIICRTMGSKQLNNLKQSDISLNWMPLTHVGGIIYFHIRDVILGATQVQVSTELILSDPLLWLDLIDKYKTTITWAPNFAYSLINDRASEIDRKKWELSSLHSILNGGEVVVASTIRKFLKLLIPKGLSRKCMRPVFGMSETCSGITYSNYFDLESNSDDNLNVSLGRPIPGVNLRIVDDKNRIISENEIGRLQIKGNTVTSGYYNNDEATKSSFTEDGWFDTGDLGFIRDNELILTGRQKDVIIINGINYYSQELESIVEEIENVEVSFCAACAIRSKEKDTDEVAIFFNPKIIDENYFISSLKTNIDNVRSLISDIRNKVIESCGIRPDYIIPLPQIDFPKSDIGKIQRLKLKRRLEQGEYRDIEELIDTFNSKEKRVKSWFYEKKWIPIELPESTIKFLDKTLLILNNGDNIDLLLNMLEEYSIKYISVKCDNKYNKVDQMNYSIRLGYEEDYLTLINSIKEDGFNVHTILDLTNIEKKAQQSMLSISTEQLIKHLLCISNRLINTCDDIKRYMVITKNAFSVEKEDISIGENAIIQGFLRSMEQEHPRLHCANIDFDKLNLKDINELIFKEMISTAKDNEVAYREKTRYLPRFEKLIEKENKPITNVLEKEGLFLVTGGLGGIGINVCKWLLKKFNGKLLIVGETDIDDEFSEVSRVRKNAMNDLRNISNEVIYKCGNVKSQQFLDRIVMEAEEQWNTSLSAIIHLAGAVSQKKDYHNSHWDELEEHLIKNEAFESYEKVFDSKIFGTIALQNLRESREQDITFIAFSSVNGHFGGVSLSAYSSGNSFLEEFCCGVSKKYNKTYCMNWTTWHGIGMSESIPEAFRTISQRDGFYSINADEGILSMEFILSQDISSCFIGLINYNEKFGFEIKDKLVENIDIFFVQDGKDSNIANDIQSTAEGFLSDSGIRKIENIEVYQLDEIPRKSDCNLDIDFNRIMELKKKVKVTEKKNKYILTHTQKMLLNIWKEILKRDDISIEDSFFESGGNSILLTKLVFRIREDLGANLSFQSLFKLPTIKDMSEAIDDNKINTADSDCMIDFKKDVFLDESIQELISKASKEKGEKNILLTGATGFLGAYILEALIEKTDSTIYCLIRSDSKARAQERIINNLNEYKLKIEKAESRIVPVLGDISKPLLGLSEDMFYDLSKTIDVIYHNGALVNFSYPYSYLKATNVDGTKEILKLAASEKIKMVHYISSLAIFNFVSESQLIVDETHTTELKRPLRSGYNQSKWVGDNLMQLAREYDIPCNIYRISTAIGDLRTGACQTKDFFWLFLKACIVLGTVPEFDFPFNLIPVDSMADSIVTLSINEKETSGSNYHLNAPNPVMFSEIISWLRDFGYPINVVSYDEWYTSLVDYLKNSNDERLTSLLATFPEDGKKESTENIKFTKFDSEKTWDKLAKANEELTPINKAIFNRNLEYFLKMGFMPLVNKIDNLEVM